jgi:hypothetical protein
MSIVDQAMRRAPSRGSDAARSSDFAIAPMVSTFLWSVSQLE